MLFNSQFFIFAFLPLVLIGWYLLNNFKLHKIALCFLVGMSLWFYGFFNPIYLLIIISSILVNFFFSFLMEKKTKANKLIFILSMIFNICLLGYFKYYDFFIENINFAFKTNFTLKHILLPLGISFFTLQQISFLIDRYLGTAPHYNLLDYSAFVTFFPQLIAGPIVSHKEMLPQFQDMEKRRFNLESFKEGIVLFIIGLSKKVLLADFFAKPVNFGFEVIPKLDTLSAWCVGLCYTIELYFDFSGYCDMAVGLGKMFNFNLPVNFNSPYKSISVPDYWSRWHITLSRFFNSYIYMPITLSGARKGKKKLYAIIAPIVVFLISGFWHGASWTFIIWGLLYALGTIWCHRKKFLKTKNKKIKWTCTFIFIVIAQTVFRSETLPNMFGILKKMFTLTYNKMIIDIGSALYLDKVLNGLFEKILHLRWQVLYPAYLSVLIAGLVFSAFLLRGKNAYEIVTSQKEKGYTKGFMLLLGVLFAWCLISMTEVSTFLYFNF